MITQPILSLQNNTKIGLADEEIEILDLELEQYFGSKLILQPTFSRPLVSFQANKSRPIYRWYKYKEAFSASLVEFLFDKYKIFQGKILDPFAGSGTALFVASERGIASEGIELLPIGQQIIATKKIIESKPVEWWLQEVNYWLKYQPWYRATVHSKVPELRITKGAYPPDTKVQLECFISALSEVTEPLKSLLQFALLCVLESISYTRKDGQYLRWDYRSERRIGTKPFDKGEILDFGIAIQTKLAEIIHDLSAEPIQGSLFSNTVSQRGEIILHSGSCLNVLPQLDNESFDAIITSPPYCNRYDYTRTYALELALLGVGESELTKLRQEMLSCTVENRAKDLLNMNAYWRTAILAADEQPLLQSILKYLDEQRTKGHLNNNGIPRMVRGYFYEMACVIADCARVLKTGAPLFMVNDNVRYAGVSISVDLILSTIAEQLGFTIENIYILPESKGNSSQQMGTHGRSTLRKCVYVWRKS